MHFGSENHNKHIGSQECLQKECNLLSSIVRLSDNILHEKDGRKRKENIDLLLEHLEQYRTVVENVEASLAGNSGEDQTSLNFFAKLLHGLHLRHPSFSQILSQHNGRLGVSEAFNHHIDQQRAAYNDGLFDKLYHRFYADVAMGDMSEVITMVRKDPEILHAKDINGCTPLHIAASNGHLEMIKIMVSFGADVNAVDYEMETPLHKAANASHSDVVSLLKEFGATHGNIQDWLSISSAEERGIVGFLDKGDDVYGQSFLNLDDVLKRNFKKNE